MANIKAEAKTELVQFRRAQIIKAATKVFGDKGYHEANISDIAAELNIGHGTFYRYFKNKRGIFESVIEDIISRVTDVVAYDSSNLTDNLKDYRAKARRTGEMLIELFVEDPAMARLLFYEALGLDDAMNNRIWQMMDVFGRFTALYLINGKEKGFLRQNLDIELTALSINSMIFEAAKRIALDSENKAISTRWLDAILALIFDSLGK